MSFEVLYCNMLGQPRAISLLVTSPGGKCGKVPFPHCPTVFTASKSSQRFQRYQRLSISMFVDLRLRTRKWDLGLVGKKSQFSRGTVLDGARVT